MWTPHCNALSWLHLGPKILNVVLDNSEAYHLTRIGDGLDGVSNKEEEGNKSGYYRGSNLSGHQRSTSLGRSSPPQAECGLLPDLRLQLQLANISGRQLVGCGREEPVAAGWLWKKRG